MAKSKNVRPWQAELRVSPELAAQLIDRQFPSLKPSRPELLGEGWDNIAYVVAGHVFRFPRRQVAVDLLLAEARLLPEISEHLPLPIPVPRYFGEPSDEFPWPFVGYRKLPGITACRARLDDDQRDVLAQPLASFLVALHQISEQLARDLGAPDDLIGRLDPAKRRRMLQERLDEAQEAGILPGRGALERVVEATPTAWQPLASTLVHGDFYVRHLLLDERRRLAGVIDWGDIHVGDAAVDLAIAFDFLSPRGRETFRRHYGPVAEDRWRVARFRALGHALALLIYGHDVGDSDLFFEGRRGLEQLVVG